MTDEVDQGDQSSCQQVTEALTETSRNQGDQVNVPRSQYGTSDFGHHISLALQRLALSRPHHHACCVG